jgi:glycosyltransferase involved in cell wall biosynthesis
MPTYNRAHLISKGIRSVLDQTEPDWELIIVDDGSTDNTQEIVKSFNDDRIHYIYQENSERSVARNNGVKNSKGDWICFLDSDDYYLPNHLEAFNKFIRSENQGACFLISGGYEERNGELVKKKLFNPTDAVHPAQFILQETIITPISVCIHRSCFNVHKFPEIFKKSYWEDTHLWIRLALSYPFFQLNEFTNVLAEHPGRSVHSKLTLTRVLDHVGMINDLYNEYKEFLVPVISKKNICDYIDRKYRMFLYQARQNKQFLVSLQIWWKAIKHKPSIYMVSELPKIFINQLGIGIHGN